MRSSHPELSEVLMTLFDSPDFSRTQRDAAKENPAKVIADRTRCRGIHAVGETHLRQIQSGVTPRPSLQVVAALADAFEVDIAYFTSAFHQRHANLSQQDRLAYARLRHRADFYRLATMLRELPRDQQVVIDALIEILR
ncbi:hypothetical protein GOEFS_124_00320 [Gordonia effusa NBRC 100432]|uniref:HTH cro/C1-type domain-containing protein n=1 Tax=Gordonia effusa NBRC 100432 TaxID=1077974 RepID=H0R6J9_9ACTN|nr:hypothetical protein [Gordonia effusa]GAB20700.1 hypothetical protein GOEFS_124_00320 [Gordonia effusa NBRC 100432]